MYRLVIVAGPNRGSSFILADGENKIGRQTDNQIVLTSAKVSRLHCTIYIDGERVDLTDGGSTNRTYVNGALAPRQQRIKAGDKLGVGDFVLELVRVGASGHTGALSRIGNHPPITLQQPGYATQGNLALSMPPPAPMPTAFTPPSMIAVEEPQDPVGKIKFHFEGKLMPIFYKHLMKTEYSVIVSVLIAIVVGATVVGSVMPTLDIAAKAIQAEAKIRAQTLAREVADRFMPAIASHSISQIDLSVLEGDNNVRMVAIVNLDMQIIAPQSRLNQILAGTAEASRALESARRFRDGDERPYIGWGGNEFQMVAIEPIRVVDPQLVKSQIAAMAIVSVDFSRNGIEEGGAGVAYGIGILAGGIAGFLVYLILMRLTMKPFEVLNDDLDQVLRGDLPKVTHEYKISELNALWENINSAASRGAKSGATSTSINEINWEHELAGVAALSEAAGLAYIAFDGNLMVVGMNEQLEKIGGFRPSDTMGVHLKNVPRADQGFAKKVEDLQSRVASSSNRSATDSEDFASGIDFDVIAVGVGPMALGGFAMIFKNKAKG